MMTKSSKPVVTAVGDNPTPIWGMSNSERLRRLARAAKLEFSDGSVAGPRLIANCAFAFDPQLLRHMIAQPGAALLRNGRPVIAHAHSEEQAAAVRRAAERDEPLAEDSGLKLIAYEDGFSLYNDQLRKRETPFVMPLEPATVAAIERASYYAAYKGVTDILTKYLWPEWALWLTRIAARIGMTPNMVTGIGALLCVAATFLFWRGDYWLGIAVALGFMVLDTVDGKLARCTITSSWWGNIFDHGIDLVHPPFWWYAWGVGLGAWGLALTPDWFWMVMGAIIAGYVVQRAIEGIFMRRFAMHIHVWEKADSDFRLITARRNPNMVILFVALVLGRPDWGLVGVAAWTIISCAFHAVRLAQAELRARQGNPITSWLVG